MDIDEIYRVGRWLNFGADTCFGKDKGHLGLFVAISDDLAICIAVNATSNVDGVKNFASRRHINPNETIVVIEPSDPESSHHFGRETAFDCNRPSIVRKNDLVNWVGNQRISLAGYNVEVDDNLLEKIREGIIKSPLVSEKYKKIIRLN